MIVKPAKAFSKAFTQKILERTYDSYLGTSKTIGLDRVSAENFAANLKIEAALIAKKVAAQTYKFTAYRQRLISKGADRPPRVLSIPTIRDRLTLRTLCDFLIAAFPSASGDIAQVKIAELGKAMATGKYTHFIKIDVEQFYPSISHKKLLTKIRKRVRKKEALSLLSSAITNPTASEKTGGKGAIAVTKGVAQGLSISNALAEIYLQDFDKLFDSNPNIFFLRYVDDVLVLCDDQFPSIEKQIFSALSSLGLSAHDVEKQGGKSKHGGISAGFDYLGYSFEDGRVSVRRSSVLALEHSIVKIFTSFKHSMARSKTEDERIVAKARLLWHLNLRITGCIYKGQRLGWVFYFSQLTDTGVLRGIDSTVETLLKRFKVSNEIKPKRVLNVFYESARIDKSTHAYIPNFDETSVADQVSILMALGFPVIGKSAAQISNMFRKKVGAAVSDLEKDLQQLS